MASRGQEVGKYVLPIMPSIEGVGPSIDKQMSKAFGNMSKSASKAISDGAKDGAAAAEAELKKVGDAYDKLSNRAKDALGKVRAEEVKLQALRDKGASDDKLVVAEERLAKARRDSDQAGKASESGHRSLLSAQRALADASGETAGKVGLLSTASEALGGALSAGAVIAAGAAVAGVAALAAGVAVAARAVYDLGSEFDDAFDSIRIKTGATGPQLAALESSVKNIAGQIPESIGDIGKVVAETSRSLHLTGTDLDNVSRAVANLGRLTGEDVDVKQLGQAFRGFGVDAKDQVPALDSLFRTYQKTGIGVNELLASVVKGGPQLREFGFDMGSSAGLITEFEEAGLDGDKALSALTKGLATFAKAGQDPKKALGDTVGEIQKLIAAGNDPAAQNIANKIFGAKAGLQIFEGVKSGALDLQQLQDTLASTGDTIQQAADDTDDFAEKWKEFKNTASVALQPLASGLFDSVNSELTDLAADVKEHEPDIIGFFTGLADVAISTAQGVTRVVAEILGDVGELVGGIGNVVGTMDKFQAWIADVRGDHAAAKDLRDQAEAAFGWGEGLKHAATEMQKFADGGMEDFKNKVKAAGDRAQEASKLTVALGDATAELPDGKSITISDNSPETIERLKGIGIQVEQTPTGLTLTATTDEAQKILDAFRSQQSGDPITPPVKPQLAPEDAQAWINQFRGYLAGAAGPSSPAVPGNPGSVIMPRARGGIDGIGTEAHIGDAVYPNGVVRYREPSTGGEAYIPLKGGDRSVDIWKETGRQLGVMAFDQGGFSPDVLAASELIGTKYSQGNRNDCSGMVARVIDRAMGIPDSGLMSTKNAAQWLAARGFKPGVGGPGMISVGWYDHGPNPNDGHMAMTLSDGTPAEAGGKNGVFTVGAGAQGADSPQFDQHMFLPNLFGEGPGGSGAYSAAAFGGAGGTAGVGPGGQAGTYAAPDAKSLREANEKVADADARAKEADARVAELKADASQSEKLAAQNAADKAHREATDARTDLAEVQKGKFTAGKPGKQQGQGGGDLNGLGGIFGSFLKETLGLDGSIFPDISNIGAVQSFGALASAFKGPLQGAIDGQLGIQQPGWQPGQPVNGVGAPSASGLPFGFAGTAQPGMAGPDGGSPLAAAIPNVDQSRNVAIQVDSGPSAAEIGQTVRKEVNNVDRLHTYVPKGA